jgi:hypothetical protein
MSLPVWEIWLGLEVLAREESELPLYEEKKRDCPASDRSRFWVDRLRIDFSLSNCSSDGEMERK